MMSAGSNLVTSIVIAVLAGACAGSGAPAHTVTGSVVAAPTCPVEPAPGLPSDPACSPAPVAGAELVVLDDSGNEVATATTDADGRYAVELPAGMYRLAPQPLARYLAAPDKVEFTVRSDRGRTLDTLTYDTGIRSRGIGP